MNTRELTREWAAALRAAYTRDDTGAYGHQCDPTLLDRMHALRLQIRELRERQRE